MMVMMAMVAVVTMMAVVAMMTEMVVVMMVGESQATKPEIDVRLATVVVAGSAIIVARTSFIA